MYRILCIDGGGIKGYYPVYILKRIEEELGINISEYFDLIVGTSTGSIIAAAISSSIPLSYMLDMYVNEGKNIFSKRNLSIRNFSSFYSNDYFKYLIKREFKGKTFQNINNKIIICTTDIDNMNPKIIKSWTENNISLQDALIASSSIPIIFNPHQINGIHYSDGGIWANNPSLVAIAESLSDETINIKLEDIKMLSIGTGINSTNSSWNVFSWAKNVSPLVIRTSSSSNDNIAKKLLKNNYLRLNFIIESNSGTSKIIENLLVNSEKYFEKDKEKIIKFFTEEKIDIKESEGKRLNIFQKIVKKIFRL